MDFQQISDTVYEMEFEITLRNHKTTPIMVQVNEPVGGTWRMMRSSHEWQKTAAWAAQFTVPVPAEGAATLKYRVRVTSSPPTRGGVRARNNPAWQSSIIRALRRDVRTPA